VVIKGEGWEKMKVYKRKAGWLQKIKIKYSKNQIEINGERVRREGKEMEKRRDEVEDFSEVVARQPTSTGASTKKQDKRHH
jgi:hypothetical protein